MPLRQQDRCRALETAAGRQKSAIGPRFHINRLNGGTRATYPPNRPKCVSRADAEGKAGKPPSSPSAGPGTRGFNLRVKLAAVAANPGCTPACCGTLVGSSCHYGIGTRLLHGLGHSNIQNTARYTALGSAPF